MAPTPKLSVAEAFSQAMQAYEDGRPQDARRIARRLVDEQPRFGGAHYLLGLLAMDQGQGRRAAESLARAIAITPGQPVLHLAMGRALEQMSNWSEAGLHYRMVLGLDADHAEAHALLGQVLQRQQKNDDAITHCRRAVQLNPGMADAWNALGLLLLETGQADQAVLALRHAVEIRPDWAAALNNFGIALRDSGQLEQARIILEGAVDLRPDHAGGLANLASVLRRQGKLEDARHQADHAVRIGPRQVECWMELGLVRQALGHLDGAAAAFDRVTALAPRNVSAWFSLAEIRRAQGERDKAVRAYEKCLALDPQDRHGAALGLALAGAKQAPGKAPEAYVRQLFDDYADHFDQALTEKLDYCAPQLLDQALQTIAPQAGDLEVLDAGCGTGLAAPWLRTLARTLHGVDLSPAMVDKARQRNLYDDLRVGELVADLLSRPASYDLIVAADVLVYLGDLEPVFAAVRDALRPGGLFAFTVERADNCPTYSLGAKQRYAHSAEYIRTLAEECSLRLPYLQDAVTRRDGGQDVPGYVVVLGI